MFDNSFLSVMEELVSHAIWAINTMRPLMPINTASTVANLFTAKLLGLYNRKITGNITSSQVYGANRGHHKCLLNNKVDKTAAVQSSNSHLASL